MSVIMNPDVRLLALVAPLSLLGETAEASSIMFEVWLSSSVCMEAVVVPLKKSRFLRSPAESRTMLEVVVLS